MAKDFLPSLFGPRDLQELLKELTRKALPTTDRSVLAPYVLAMLHTNVHTRDGRARFLC